MKSHAKIFLFITYSQLCNSSVNPLYITNKINGYIEENNWNKYLTLVPTDESKDLLKKYENYETNSDNDDKKQ